MLNCWLIVCSDVDGCGSIVKVELLLAPVEECVNIDVSVELNMLFIADVSISEETIVLV